MEPSLEIKRKKFRHMFRVPAFDFQNFLDLKEKERECHDDFFY